MSILRTMHVSIEGRLGRPDVWFTKDLKETYEPVARPIASFEPAAPQSPIERIDLDELHRKLEDSSPG